MSQDYDGRPAFASERSWSMLANETFLEEENEPPRYYNKKFTPTPLTDNYTQPPLLSEKSWSVLPSNDAEERRFLNFNNDNYSMTTAVDDSDNYNNAYSHGDSSPPSITRETTATGFPEPEFKPSLGSSANDFLEETFKFEENFVGQPNDHADLTPRASKIYNAYESQQVTQQPQQFKFGAGWYTSIAVSVIAFAIAVYFVFFNL